MPVDSGNGSTVDGFESGATDVQANGAGHATGENVCAVVVTHNRKGLLRVCLKALEGQTWPLQIIMVVDNCSTDGTQDMLRTEFPKVVVITMPSNVGGAGGFHAGVTHAMQTDAQWLWLLDDDGVPESTALEALLGAPSDVLVRNCLVIASDDESGERLAFDNTTRRALSSSWTQGFVPDLMCPFNGFMVHRVVVEKVGLPNADFFMWGDELDYWWRIKRAGFAMGAVLGSVLRHPSNRPTGFMVSIGPKTFRVWHVADPVKNYLLIRNHAFLTRRYQGRWAWLRRTFIYTMCYGSRNLGLPWTKVLAYSWEGYTGRLSGHVRLLERFHQH